MRIDDEGVGELDAVLRPALLFADPRRSGVRGVDVHPGARRVRPLGELADRIDGCERGRADRRDNGCDVVGPEVVVDAHAQLVVHGHLAELHAEHARGLVDG